MKLENNEIAILGIAATMFVGIIVAMATDFANKREQRRILYNESVQAIASWKEMLYMIRRREARQEREIINSFHELQDNLSHYMVCV